jgi:hypothetical protein
MRRSAFVLFVSVLVCFVLGTPMVVHAAPVISSLSLDPIVPGGSLQVSGSGFGSTQGTSSVTDRRCSCNSIHELERYSDSVASTVRDQYTTTSTGNRDGRRGAKQHETD